MLAINFVLDTDMLREKYHKSFDYYFDEIYDELNQYGFKLKEGNLYINDRAENSLADVYRAINWLSRFGWFRESVLYFQVFKIEDLSDFTDIIKNG